MAIRQSSRKRRNPRTARQNSLARLLLPSVTPPPRQIQHVIPGDFRSQPYTRHMLARARLAHGTSVVQKNPMTIDSSLPNRAGCSSRSIFQIPAARGEKIRRPAEQGGRRGRSSGPIPKRAEGLHSAAGWRNGRWLIRFSQSRYGLENTRWPNPTRRSAGRIGQAPAVPTGPGQRPSVIS
jgi:hypothetical protein